MPFSMVPSSSIGFIVLWLGVAAGLLLSRDRGRHSGKKGEPFTSMFSCAQDHACKDQAYLRDLVNGAAGPQLCSCCKLCQAAKRELFSTLKAWWGNLGDAGIQQDDFPLEAVRGIMT